MSNSPATLGGFGEFSLIKKITADLVLGPDVVVGPGDDGAVLTLQPPLVTSLDVLVEGVHFRRDWSPARDVGRKAVAVNVSDLEAMGARATALVVGFSAPPSLELSWALEFAGGLTEEATAAGVSLIGGDVTRARDITISVTVLGTLDGRAPVLRSGARAGDVVAVHGRLGWAAAGLVVLGRGFRSPRVVVEAHRMPQVSYGAGATAAAAGATAMIDVSDGLLADLGHIAAASGVTDRPGPRAPSRSPSRCRLWRPRPAPTRTHWCSRAGRTTRWPRRSRTGRRSRTAGPWSGGSATPTRSRSYSSTARRGRPRPGSTTSAPSPDRRVTHRFGRLFA